ncbi:KTSC domain-containing protein [Nocardioides hungaricus]
MELVGLHRSKAVAAVGYDPASRTLRVRFRHGGLYDYLDVSPEIYDGLLTDEHPWTRYGAEIKDDHRWRRVEE